MRQAGILALSVAGWLVASSAVAFAASRPGGTVSAARSYRINLTTLVSGPGQPAGLLVTARIDGGPKLRLLLDSGAQYIVLDKKAAARSGRSAGASIDLVGAGESGPRVARQTEAETVNIGELSLHDCPMLIADGKVLDGMDGVAPLSLFAGFLIRLDTHRNLLSLSAYPTSQFEEGFVRARVSNGLLFLRAALSDSWTGRGAEPPDAPPEGYFLLDTGALYNAISDRMARTLNVSRALAVRLPVETGTGPAGSYQVPFDIRLNLGTRELTVRQAIAVDLAIASKYHQLEIAGLIGYPVLRDSILTVNYRDALVRIDPL